MNDGENIAVVHCKAGKGRTGTIISGYMLYTGMFNSYLESIYHFNEKRTNNNKGVTIPSQIM